MFKKVLINITIISLIMFCPLIAESDAAVGKMVLKQQVFKSTDGDYSIQFPSKWGVKKGFMGTDVIALAPLDGSEDIFRENVNIIFTILDTPMTADEYYSLNMKSLEQLLTDFELEESEHVTLDGNPAFKILYTYRMGTVDAKVIQYLFLIDNRAYVITFTANPESFEDYQQRFEGIVRSFKFSE